MNKILFLSFVLLSLVACNDAKVNSNSSNSSNSSNITENDKVDYIITYTSSDGETVSPCYDAKTPFNANIINNTYENGMGKISFDNPVTSIGREAFYDRQLLTSITFQGTKAQWEEIALDEDWNSNVSTKVVHCTDGDVEVQMVDNLVC